MVSILGPQDRDLLRKAMIAIGKAEDSALVVSSACSGTEVHSFAGAALFSVLHFGQGKRLKYKVRFACEKAPSNIAWIQKVLHHAGHDSCIFDDYGKLDGESAECLVHQPGRCFISSGPAGISIIIHTAGFSCKDLSKAKGVPAETRNSTLMDRTGTTGDTFDDLLQHLQSHCPPCYVGENSDELANKQHANYHVFIDAMLQIGYVSEVFALCAEKYRSPARRARAWIIALNLKVCGISSDEAKRLIQLMMQTIARLECGGMDFHDMMLSNTHVVVQKELRARQRKGAALESHPWEQKFGVYVRKHGLDICDCYPPASVRGFPWFACIPPRGQATLGYVMHLHPDWTVVDWAQDVGRPYWSEDTTMYTLVPTSQPFVRKFNRPILGCEALMMQGVPNHFLLQQLACEDDKLTDRCLRDMAGNAYAGATFLAVLIGVLTHLPPHAHIIEQILSMQQVPAHEVAEAPELDDILSCLL